MERRVLTECWCQLSPCFGPSSALNDFMASVSASRYVSLCSCCSFCVENCTWLICCSPCTHCVQYVVFVRYTQTTSGGVRSERERYASGWRCSVKARVDASGASGTAATHRLRRSADYPISFHSINFNDANRASRHHDTVG